MKRLTKAMKTNPEKSVYKTSHEFSFLLKHGLKAFFARVDISSLVAFRIFFGIIMLVEVYRYFEKGWIPRYWIEPKLNFPYWPFHFLTPFEGNGMYYLFIGFGILSFFILIGLFYRTSMSLFFIGFTYMYLLEQTRYLNHFYLIVILSLVLIFLPAHRKWSLDSILFKNKSETQPLWSLWLLRFMIALPFFFGGVAKINSDWLKGQPLQMWLRGDTDFPLIGQFFDERWMILLLSYSGLFLDLLLVPFLLFKKTRVPAFLLGLLFHLMNAELFTIGIFPWFMILATTMFFKPSWPRRFVNIFRRNKSLIPENYYNPENFKLSKPEKTIAFAVVCWMSLMCLYPLRHFVIPGNVSWTEGGHKYAWHMKLRSKRAKGDIIVKEKTGKFEITINPDRYLESWQKRKVLARPGILWLYAKKLKRNFKYQGFDVEVYADIRAKLNGRPYQQLIDPNVDLTSVPFPVFGYADWIVPLETDLIIKTN